MHGVAADDSSDNDNTDHIATGHWSWSPWPVFASVASFPASTSSEVARACLLRETKTGLPRTKIARAAPVNRRPTVTAVLFVSSRPWALGVEKVLEVFLFVFALVTDGNIVSERKKTWEWLKSSVSKILVVSRWCWDSVDSRFIWDNSKWGWPDPVGRRSGRVWRWPLLVSNEWSACFDFEMAVFCSKLIRRYITLRYILRYTHYATTEIKVASPVFRWQMMT